MKAGYIFSNTYTDLEAQKVRPPTPRRLFDAAKGQRTLQQAFDQAKLADELGFDWVSISEHHFAPLMLTPNAAVAGGALSQILKRAELGWLGPVLPITNPVRVAEEIAMLDQLMGGKLFVFLLRGTPGEHLFYNVPAEETYGRTEEAIGLIIRALTEPEPFAHKGQFYDFPSVSVWPGATQTPHPPIFASGNSEGSARFAGRNRLKAAISFFPPDMVAKLLLAYREAAAQAGWTPIADDILYRGFCVVGETDGHAQEMAARFIPGAPPSASRPGNGGAEAAQRGPDRGAIGVGRGTLQFCGSAETVAEQIRAFHEATGAGRLDLGFGVGGMTQDETMDSIRRFGQQVLPCVRD